MMNREVCSHCGRDRPSYIADPHCAAATERSSWVYCEWVPRPKPKPTNDAEAGDRGYEIIRTTIARFVAMRRYQHETAIHFSGDMVRACEEFLKLAPELAKGDR